MIKKIENKAGEKMATVFDYLDWRGDVPFSADPFQEVDNLVLAELAYTDLKLPKVISGRTAEMSCWLTSLFIQSVLS